MIAAGLVMSLALLASGPAPTAPARPYVDPSQLDLPVPYFSFARQPWRSYLEATPGTTLLDGVGVVWGPAVAGHGDEELAARIAAAGISRVRLEIPWGAIRWDESGIVPEHAGRIRAALAAFKAQRLRPMILLNAHHNAPCPMQVRRWRLAAAAPVGSRALQVVGPTVGLSAGDSLVLTLGDSVHAGPLVTDVSPATGTLELSKPSARRLEAGDEVLIGEVKYLPLHPLGTPQFEQTADGWIRYVGLVMRLVTDVYGPEFDVEIWNELSFGSEFLAIEAYFDPPASATAPDPLRRGGRVWELGRRTVAEVARVAPGARTVWGFSNTTFFHTPVAELPPGLAGQSYHPYGVGPRCYAQLLAGRERYNADGLVPAGCAVMPEGWAQTFQQTETLMRLLNPAARAARPPGTDRFAHFFTEHGFSPAELGIQDTAAALRAKQKFLLRAPLFWLNKGLSALYVYDAYEADDRGFGVLRGAGSTSPATTTLHALLTRFVGAQPISSPRPVAASLRRTAGRLGAYGVDPGGRVVAQEDIVAVLPFQLDAKRFVVGLYVMTEDFPRDLEPQDYTVRLSGIAGRGATVRYYDPLSDSMLPLSVVATSAESLTVRLSLTDAPRVLEVTES